MAGPHQPSRGPRPICLTKKNIYVPKKGTICFKQKFGFIKRVDKGEITTVKDLESWCFEH